MRRGGDLRPAGALIVLARLRRYYRLLVVSLLSLALTLPMRPAAAYEIPMGPYSATDLKILYELSRWGPGSLITPAAGAAAVIAGGFLGISPLGWAGLGLVVLGAVLVSGDTESPQGYTAVIVGSQPSSAQQNPDLGADTAPTMKTGPWVFTRSTYIYSDTIPPSQAVTSAMLYWILGRMGSAEVNYVKEIDSSSVKWGTACPDVSAVNSKQTVMCYLGRTNVTGTYSWNYQMFRNDVAATTCPTDFEFVPVQNKCVYKPPTLADGICRVSLNAAGTGYEYNQADGDCLRAVSKMKLSLSPSVNGGPPAVVMQDPGTGNVLIAQGGGTGTSAPFTVTERAPNTQTQVVKQTVVTTSPGTTTPTNPKAAPVMQNTDSSYHHGSNPNVAPTSPAIAEVAVTNWPSSVSVTGTVTCSNCSSAAPNVTVNVPDRMKIDGEVPGEFSTLPAAPADLPAADSFIGKLKTRLAGFADFKLPAHTSSCPAIDIHWHAWMVNIDASSNYMCSFLEQNRVLFQGLMTFAFTVGAIIILLGA